MARIPRKKGFRERHNRNIMVADEKGNYAPAQSNRRIFYKKVFLGFIALLLFLIAIVIYLFVFEKSDERRILGQNTADRDVVEQIDREVRTIRSSEPVARQYQELEGDDDF